MGTGRRNNNRGGGDAHHGRESGQEGVENCPTERDIEQLALGRVRGRRRNRLDDHIETCFTCNETYRAFSYFYQQAKKERVPEGAYPGMAAPLPHPLSDYIVHLEPVHHPESLSEDADTGKDDVFTRLCVCSSVTGQFTGTVLLDRKSGDILLRLDAGADRTLGHVSVHIDGIRDKVLTDARGIAVLGGREPSLFLDAHIRLCLPLLEIRSNVGVDLNQEELFNPDPIPGFPVESVWVYIDEENSLCLELGFSTEDGDHRRYTAACIGRGKPMIIPVFGGVGVFRKVSLGAPLLISVYPN